MIDLVDNIIVGLPLDPTSRCVVDEPDGVPIRLPDGHEWTFYQPAATSRPVLDPDGRLRQEIAWDFGDCDPALYEMLDRRFADELRDFDRSPAGSGEGRVAILILMYCCVAANYAITINEFHEIISRDEPDEAEDAWFRVQAQEFLRGILGRRAEMEESLGAELSLRTYDPEIN